MRGYKSIIWNRFRREITVWDGDKSKKRTEKYEKPIYVKEEGESDVLRKDLYGTPVRLISEKEREAYVKWDTLKWDDKKRRPNPLKSLEDLCEEDLDERVAYLQEKYRDVDLQFTMKDFHVAYLDIEVAAGNGGYLPSQEIMWRKAGTEDRNSCTILELERMGTVGVEVYDRGAWRDWGESMYAFSDFPSPEKARYPVNLITVTSNRTGIATTFGVGEYKGNSETVQDYRAYRTEISMLKAFFQWFKEQKFDILTGWNSNGYDIPYLYVRTAEQLGRDFQSGEGMDLMSPVGKIRKVMHRDKTGQFRVGVSITGLLTIDYLELYKKFVNKTEVSYKLQDIGQSVVGQGKVQYEGSINNFYKTNWDRFVEYNIQDVRLVEKIDAKKRLLELCITLAYQTLIPIDCVFSTIKTCEGYVIRTLHGNGMVLPNRREGVDDWWAREGMFNAKVRKDPSDPNSELIDVVENLNTGDDDEEEEDWSCDWLGFVDSDGEQEKSYAPEADGQMFYVKGGHVESNPGLFKDSLCFDVASLYPHVIIQYNISPETKVTIHDDCDKSGLIESEINGVWYRREKGVLPLIIKKIYDERAKFKKAMFGEKHGSDQYNYFHSMQMVRKILINSFYGAMINKWCHFYDVDLARSVTRGGRVLIRFLTEKGEKAARMLAAKPEVVFPGAKPFVPKDRVLSLIDTDSVVGDTLVKTFDGEVKISDLFDWCDKKTEVSENNFIGTISDVRALCVKESCETSSGLKMEYRPIKYVKKHLVKKNFYEVRIPSYGCRVEMTEDHSLIVYRDGGLKSVKPTSVRPWDTLLISYDNKLWATKSPEWTIEPLGEKQQWVYDIEVKWRHNFFGNGILVHNSNHLHFDEYHENLAPEMPTPEFLHRMEVYMEAAFAHALKKKADVKGLEQVIKFKREGVIIGELVLAKKKYASLLIQNEDEIYDTPYFKVTGIEIARSSTPKWVKEKMTDTIIAIMNGMNKNDLPDRIDALFEEFKTQDIDDISCVGSISTLKPVGGQIVENAFNGEWRFHFDSGTPMRNKAVMAYNEWVKRNKMPYELIFPGTKLKYIPIHDDGTFKNDVIAWVGECPPEIKKVIRINYEKQFETFVNLINSISELMGWEKWPPKRSSDVSWSDFMS